MTPSRPGDVYGKAEAVQTQFRLCPAGRQTRPKGGECLQAPNLVRGSGRKLRQVRERVAASNPPSGRVTRPACHADITDRADKPGTAP